MGEFIVLTAIGSDRIGLVDDITDALAGRNLNIEESRMAVLGGEFAMIVLVSGSDTDIEAIANATDDIGNDLGISISTKRTTTPPIQSQARPYLIESVSLDTPGIVHAITTILRGYDINIEDLETDTTAAPWTGAPMFTLKARILVPSGVTINNLRDEIEALAEKRDLDITIQPITGGST